MWINNFYLESTIILSSFCLSNLNVDLWKSKNILIIKILCKINKVSINFIITADSNFYTETFDLYK